jgi:WD40 repeat protein
VVTPHSSALAVFNLVEDAAAQDTDLRAGRISEIAWQPDSRRFVVVTADADLFICAAGNPPDCVPSPWAAYAWDVVVVSAGPDGRRALVAYRPFEALLRVELVTTWDLVEGELLAVLSDAINSSGTAAWMPDGEAISLASAGTRAVYDADTGEELVRLRQGAGAVWLTADRARVITQFGSPQPGEQIGQKIVSLYAWGMQDWLAAGVGESDLRIVSATSYTISAWDTQQGREAHVLAGGFASRPTQAVFSPDGSAVAVRVDARWLVWQFEGDASPLPLADSRRAQDVHWLPDSRRVAAAVDGQVVLWEIGQDQPVSRLDGGDSLIRAIDISRDGRWLASGSADGAILIWDVETGERLHTYRAAEQIYRLRWSPDGTRLAALLKDGDDAHLLIWQPANGQYVATRTGLHRFVSVEWRSDEEMAIIAYPTLWLWNLRTGHSRRVDLDNPLPAPGLLALLDQNRLLAYSPSQQTIGWWDVTSGYFLYRLAVPVNPPGKQDGAIVLGADGHWMAISRAGEVEIWHITR